jgi:cardiolipin synthase
MYRALPNIVTILRIIAVPVVVVLLMDNALATAFWVILVAGLSDGLDGFLAKRLNAVTRLVT